MGILKRFTVAIAGLLFAGVFALALGTAAPAASAATANSVSTIAPTCWDDWGCCDCWDDCWDDCCCW